MWTASIMTFSILLGICMIIQGVRKSYVSGFKFYVAAGLLESILFFLLPVYLLVDPKLMEQKPMEPKYVLGAILVSLIISRLAGFWEDRLKQKARETHPLKWQEWENTINQARVLDRLLFYRGARRNQTDQDVKVVSHELTK